MNQKGIAPLILFLILAFVTGATAIVLIKNNSIDSLKTQIKQEFPNDRTFSLPSPSSDTAKINQSNLPNSNPTGSASAPQVSTFIPTPTSSPIPILTPKPIPTIPPLRNIVVSGFTYEDRNDDGLFNSDDPKIPYMQLYVYDSYKPNDQISTIFSESDGNFTIALNVRGDLILNPTTYNNFRPRDGQQRFSSSVSGIKFAFRSASAPVVNQVGIIEGDIFQDSNKNGNRDSGEQGIYFYKLYLVDDQGNYYENSTQNAQATDAGGHFKYMNLPVGRNFTLRLSNPTGDYTIFKPETTINLTNTYTQNTNVQIPVFKN